MRLVMVVVVVLLVASTAGVAYAQYPGVPKPPLPYDPVASMKYTFQIGAPDPAVQEIQGALQEQGYYSGPLDGFLSPDTKAAVWNFQRAKGLPATALLDRVTVLELGVGGGAAYASPPTMEPSHRAIAPPHVWIQTP